MLFPGRAFAAYAGVYLIGALVWMAAVDRVRPDSLGSAWGDSRAHRCIDYRVRSTCHGSVTSLPIACQLTDPEFRARRNGLLAVVRAIVVSAAWQANGLVWNFHPPPRRFVTSSILSRRNGRVALFFTSTCRRDQGRQGRA